MISIVALLLIGLVSVRGDAVAFSAALSHDVTMTAVAPVVFDTVFTNVGAGYNPSTGIFVAPQSGIYLFQFHTLAEENAEGYLELYHNAYYIVSTYASSTDYASAGNSVILKITKGDTVEIKNAGGTKTVLYGVAGDEIYNTFTGYLLAPVSEEINIGRK